MDEASVGPRPLPRVGMGLGRARGLATLAAIAAAGAVVWKVDSPRPPPHVVEASDDPPSTFLYIADTTTAGDPAAALLIVSRLRAAFDPWRSILSLEDGRERVVPRGAAAVLVHADGRVEAFREPLLSGTLLRLLRSYPISDRARQLREWVAGTKPFPHGVGMDERLRRFLEDR